MFLLVSIFNNESLVVPSIRAHLLEIFLTGIVGSAKV